MGGEDFIARTVANYTLDGAAMLVEIGPQAGNYRSVLLRDQILLSTACTVHNPFRLKIVSAFESSSLCLPRQALHSKIHSWGASSTAA
jgi:hypothetical protein